MTKEFTTKVMLFIYGMFIMYVVLVYLPVLRVKVWGFDISLSAVSSVL